MNTQHELDSYLLSAVEWARAAGLAHLRYFRKGNLDIRTKLNDADIVTVADAEAEQAVISGIRAMYPSHAILSEESGSTGSDSPFRWVIDPLDGTTNFSSGLPLFSVSIALEYEGETVVGVVYAPYLGELFTAVRGGGAWLNGERISCATNAVLERAVVSTGFPVDKNVNPDNNVDNLIRVLPHVRGMRRLGSAAIDICYVAAGFLDAYWEMNLHRWDVASGLLIASEAGARYESFRSDRNESIVVASAALFPEIRPLIG